MLRDPGIYGGMALFCLVTSATLTQKRKAWQQKVGSFFWVLSGCVLVTSGNVINRIMSEEWDFVNTDVWLG